MRHRLALAALLVLLGPAHAVEEPEVPRVGPAAPLRPGPPLIAADRAGHAALVAAKARQMGVPPAFADAVARVESGYDPTAISPKGAVGLMQVMPATARLLGYAGEPRGLFEPETNVQLGMTYLAQAWRLTGGGICRTVLKYYAGHRAETMILDAVTYCRRVVWLLDRAGYPVPAPDRELVETGGGPLAIGMGFRPRGRPLAYMLRAKHLKRLLPRWLTDARITMEQARVSGGAETRIKPVNLRIMQ